ncbi:tetratricopeptide repeat protein [Salimicrobium flavidum]|uniref:Uncharacterized protein n=1 Tax=Salimicrobium flavidum TaxID=570947 RepID=A0A1N7KFC5_9BACI|nr:tetratricopeptide repeat protein [Salimicrobium flavidum]SIS60190.1 hypothetical protein SAMN05421687_11117 [Salimicrobium flavidum]
MPRSSDDIIEEIREAKRNLEEEKGGYYHLIDLYRKLRQQLRKEKDRDAAADVEEKLVYYLVEHGSNLKMLHEKKDNEAIDSLKQALHFDFRLPLAHYRLGFLYYRQERFTEAGYHFSEALRFQEEARRFQLGERQLYYAHLYLINSELHVIYATHEQMKNLDMEGRYDPLESAQVHELYEKMMNTDEYLEKNAFIKRTNEGETFISYKEMEELSIEDVPGVLYLSFEDRTINVTYNGEVRNLSKDDGEVLFYLLQYSEVRPLNRRIFGNLVGEWGEVQQTTLRQRISRLNWRLEDVGMGGVIVSKRQDSNTSKEHEYVIDPKPSYVIVHRADESFHALSWKA